MDLVFKPGQKFCQAGVICADLTERLNLCLGNNNAQSKYHITSNFPSKTRCNEMSLPNKAPLVSEMHLFGFQLLACMRALRLNWPLCCTLVGGCSVWRRLPMLTSSRSSWMQYSHLDSPSRVMVPVGPWREAHVLKFPALTCCIFSHYQITGGGWI